MSRPNPRQKWAQEMRQAGMVGYGPTTVRDPKPAGSLITSYDANGTRTTRRKTPCPCGGVYRSHDARDEAYCDRCGDVQGGERAFR